MTPNIRTAGPSAIQLRLIDGGAGQPSHMMKWEKSAWDRLMARPEEYWSDVLWRLKLDIISVGLKVVLARLTTPVDWTRPGSREARQDVAAREACRPLEGFLEEAVLLPVDSAQIREEMRYLITAAEVICGDGPARYRTLVKRIRQRLAEAEKRENRPKPVLVCRPRV